MTHVHNKEYLATPIAIIIAGIIIALAIFFGMQSSRTGTPVAQVQAVNNVQNAQAGQQVGQFVPITIPSLSPTDHFLGNAKAKVVVVEYSDTECPFCKKFDPTMHQIIDNYGKEVAWVYRHLPLPMHPKARKEAEATECAAELGGNAAFWKYLSRLYEVTPSNNGLDAAELPKIASYIGLDAAKFTTCLDSGKYSAKIDQHMKEAAAAGGTGTPYSVIISPKGTTPVQGAVPYETIEQMIKSALGK